MENESINVYGSLNSNKNEIRVLKLKPLEHNRRQGLDEKTIVCWLERRDLDDGTVYSALSYAWADTTGLEEINLGRQKCFISKNLADALRHLRNESQDVVLWVDQLCINQKNLLEKRSQIQKMKRIYEESVQVIAWIGKSSGNSDLVFTTLRHIAEASTMPSNFAILSDIIQESRFSGDKQDLLDLLGEALSAFTSRSYWTRLWILQEFVVATKLVIQCGTQTISDSILSKAWNALGDVIKRSSRSSSSNLGTPNPSNAEVFAIAEAWQQNRWDSWLQIRRVLERRRDYRRRSQTGDLYSHKSHSMFTIMYTTLTTFFGQHLMLCSDPKDRVFALLGLASDYLMFNQFPDYTKSIEAIYEETSRIFLQQGFVDVLSFCQEPPNLKARNMPSWAVDWSLKIRLPPWGKLDTTASKGLDESTKILVQNDKTINICGIIVGKILSVGTSRETSKPLNPTQVQTFLREMRSFCDQSWRIPSDKEEFLCAQIAAPVARCYLSSQSHVVKEYQAACQYFEKASSLPDPDQDEQTENEKLSVYASELSHQLYNCPFMSDNDYVGVAPPYIQKGDYICIFPGGNTPYILRAQPGSNNFIVIGAAFVHGIMYGEYCKLNSETQWFSLV